MEFRYEKFAATGVRNITGYNQLIQQKNAEDGENRPILPFIVVIVDELADLMMVASNEVEDAIIRLAQMARAAGIHMILATQRPSVDVITGIIKANVLLEWLLRSQVGQTRVPLLIPTGRRNY